MAHEQPCCPHDEAAAGTAISGGSSDAESVRRHVFHIENMDCPTEEALIRSKLSTVPGVSSLDFDLVQRKLTVSHTLDDIGPVLVSLQSIGMKAKLETPDARTAKATRRPAIPTRHWGLIALAGISAMAAEIVAWFVGNESSPMVIALALLAVASGGFETYKRGWIALRNKNLNINALMSIAVTGAMLIGQWPEAAMVMFLFALAEIIEGLSLDRARNAIRELLAMAPETALVRQADETWTEMEAGRVPVGAILRVGPGNRVPLDGVLVSGQSSVNQAPITGESIPVDKQTGDAVFAGSINETGAFDYRVTALASESTLARIIKSVEEAQASRAPTQRFVDRFARIYTPLVVIAALLVATMLPLLFGLPWTDSIYKALVLLVIACPCALVIATPVTVVSGLVAAARHGILIKGGAYLEEGRRLRTVALDKTGTITRGHPSVVDFQVLSPHDPARIMQLAASLAIRSDHPVSRAIAKFTSDKAKPLELDEFSAIPGRGVRGGIGYDRYHLGNHRLVEELSLCTAQLETRLEALERQGKSAVVLLGAGDVLGVFGVADTVRETSREALADLHALGVRTVMLTGDNETTARTIAGKVGIDDVRAELRPEDKLKAISALHEEWGTVGMVGDGINDAPALAKSNIGFAMGAAGSDTAIETADVALMEDDLRKIPQFIRLSRSTAAILKQNIAIALAIKGVFLVLAVIGEATLWMAVFADMGASLIVIFNGLRLLRQGTGVISRAFETASENIVRGTLTHGH